MSERRGLRSLLDRFVIFNPAVCNPAWQGMALNTRLRPLMLEGLARLLTFMAKEAVAPSARPAGKPVVVAVGSQNNYRSAIAALGAREDVEIVTFHNLRREDCGRIGLFRQYLTGLWILPFLPLLWLAERRPHVRRALLARTDELVLAMGSGSGIRSYLNKAQPRLIVLMSTLSPYHNVIIEQARRQGIATLFMTHAPLGRAQMPLPTDYAVLDGEFQRSLFPASHTRIAITGSGRGAELTQGYVDRSEARGLLVATNTLIRDLGEIEALLIRLRELYGKDLPVVIRPHPADRVRFAEHRELADRLCALYQDPSRPLSDGVENCKYLVTTQSGVVLDALLLGFYPLLLRSPELDRILALGPNDYYGFEELDLARIIDLADPHLPESWDARRNLPQLEKSAHPGWDTQAALNSAIDRILAGGQGFD